MFPHPSVIQRLIFFPIFLKPSIYSLSACHPKTPFDRQNPTKDDNLQSKVFAQENPPNVAKRTPNRPLPSVRFEHLNIENGLAQSEVWAIAQDPLGFLWFSTRNGLSKYDSYTFKTYRHDLEDFEVLQNGVVITMIYGCSKAECDKYWFDNHHKPIQEFLLEQGKAMALAREN